MSWHDNRKKYQTIVWNNYTKVDLIESILVYDNLSIKIFQLTCYKCKFIAAQKFTAENEIKEMQTSCYLAPRISSLSWSKMEEHRKSQSNQGSNIIIFHFLEYHKIIQ